MRKKKARLAGWIGAAALLAAALPPGAATADEEAEVREVFQYAAKFVCGASGGPPDPVTPGDYATTINLRNPTLDAVRLRAHVLASFVGGPLAEPAVEDGESEMPIRTRLEPLEARQVACDRILGRVPDAANGVLVEGWVVLLADRSIDVTAVYTASGNGEVAMDVEPVSERLVRRHMPADGDKIVVCHVPPGNPAAAHAIEIDPAALPAHLAHGDTEGACPDDGPVDAPDDEVQESLEGSRSGGRRR